MSDTVEETTPGEVAKVEAQAEKVAAEAEKVEAKLDDPKTSDAEKQKLEERLNSLDTRMDKLIEKLDKLASSPVVPAPQKTVETVAEEKVAVPEKKPEESVKPRRARVSARWFGERAYED